MITATHPTKQLAAQIKNEWVNVNNAESAEERQHYLDTIARLEELQGKAAAKAQA